MPITHDPEKVGQTKKKKKKILYFRFEGSGKYDEMLFGQDTYMDNVWKMHISTHVK